MSINNKTRNILFVLIIFLCILEIVVFASSIFLQVRVQYADTNNELLKMISSRLWKIGFVLYAATIVIALILLLSPGKDLKYTILIVVCVCMAILAGSVKQKSLSTFPNGGEWTIIGKERDYIGYRLQLRTTSPYSKAEVYIYCTETSYKRLNKDQAYDIYFSQNPYFDLGCLRMYYDENGVKYREL